MIVVEYDFEGPAYFGGPTIKGHFELEVLGDQAEVDKCIANLKKNPRLSNVTQRTKDPE